MKVLEQIAPPNKIVEGDSLVVLKALESETMDLVITSPPYFQQRDYGNGNLGIEINPEYVHLAKERLKQTANFTQELFLKFY